MSAPVPDDKVEQYEHFFRDPRVGEGVLRPPLAGIACRNIRDALRFLDYRLEPGDHYDAELMQAMIRFQTDRRHTSSDGLLGPGTRKLLTRAVLERGEGFFKRGRVSPEFAVFLSYSRQDEAALTELLAGLRARGIPLFRDKEDIPGGASWPDMLYRSVLKCQVFLCMLSPKSADSIHVLIEVALARHAARRIIPVLVQPVQLPRALAALLEGIQYVDLTDQANSDDALREILGVLKLHGIVGAEQSMASPDDLDTELARLDREWEAEREQYLMQGRMGRRYRPSALAGVIAIVVGGGLGLLWTIGSSLAVGRGGGAAALMPVFGVVFTLLSVAFGASGIWKARAYGRAERDYLARRERLFSAE